MKQFTFSIFGVTFAVQVRYSLRTRAGDPLPPIVIDETKRAETVAALNLDDIRARAAKMRAELAA